MHTFDVKTLKANGGPCDGDYFGLPLAMFGTPEMKHQAHLTSMTPRVMSWMVVVISRLVRCRERW